MPKIDGRKYVLDENGRAVWSDSLVTHPVQGTAQALGGFMRATNAAFNRGATNLGETLGVLDEDPQRELDFRAATQGSPLGTAVGTLGAATGAALPLAFGGAAGMTALMARLGVTGLPAIAGIGAAELLGGAAGSAATAEGDFAPAFAFDAAFGLLGNMALRVGRGIFNVANDIKVKRPVERGADTQTGTELVENLQDAGGVLTGGQALGSPALLTAESALETAIGGGPLKGLREANQKLLTRKAAESIGLEDVDELSGVVLGNAGKAIGREMTDIAEGVGEMTVPRGFANRIRNLDDPTIVLEDKTVRMIEQMAKQFDAIIKKGGTIDAQTYSTVRQNLTKNVRGFSGADGTLNDLEVTSAAIEALDSVLRGSLPPGQGDEILEQLASARERYRNYIALSRGNTVGSDGVVSPALLANSLSQVYGNTFKQGAQAVRNVPTAELFDLATGLSTRRMKPALGSSGTAERNQMLAGAAQLGPAIMGIASGDLSTAAIAASPLVVPGLISLGARAGPLSDLGGAIQTAVTTGSGNLLNQ